MVDEKVLCAGFGGQGVMSLGQLLAYSGMLQDREVSWMPSYGPEMRGGPAYCCVMLSDKPVGSPVITNDASCVIVMNLPSFLRFESAVAPGGLLLVNSSMIDLCSTRKDIAVYYVPANELAMDCGSNRVANMVMLGAYLAVIGAVSAEHVTRAMAKVFTDTKARHIPMNIAAFKRGIEWVKREGKNNSTMWDIAKAA